MPGLFATFTNRVANGTTSTEPSSSHPSVARANTEVVLRDVRRAVPAFQPSPYRYEPSPTSTEAAAATQSQEDAEAHEAEVEFLLRGAVMGEDDSNFFINAPLFTRDAWVLRETLTGRDTWKLRSVFAAVVEQHGVDLSVYTDTPQLYLNSATPFSAVICGVQGSGKSHSLSALLESCFIGHPSVGAGTHPLAGIAFHYASVTFGQPCEAASLAQLADLARGVPGCKAPNVTILVSPTSLITMRATYAHLPNVSVQPLQLGASDVNASRLLALMGGDDTTSMPLYMCHVLTLLRNQGSDNFDYGRLRAEIDGARQYFNDGQNSMLSIRLGLLDSFCPPHNHLSVKRHFVPGTLVIVDLSDPMLGEGVACTLFDTMLGLFLEADLGTAGKLVALDEAHTFLSSAAASSNFNPSTIVPSPSSKLTASLARVIRLQRHLGVRVVIATQEPTCVAPEILDLVSFIVAHRFSSPAWALHLDRHIAAKTHANAWFDKVSSLPVGHALVFSPGIVVRCDCLEFNGDDDDEQRGQGLTRLGRGYLRVAVRPRLTRDGGRSKLAM